MQTTIKPDVVTFETDFGVKFGVLIGFDLVMPEPATSLLKMGITHFVNPTFWFNELPFSTGSIKNSDLPAHMNKTYILFSLFFFYFEISLRKRYKCNAVGLKQIMPFY